MNVALSNFLPSQLGDKSQTPVAWNGNPWHLLMSDIALCFANWRHVPGIFVPLKLDPRTADPFGELYLNFTNMKCLILQVISFFVQGIFLLTLPVFLFVPVAWTGFYIGGFFAVKYMLCFLLNGNKMTLEPSQKLVEKFTGHENEYWIFMNGVSVGKDWLQANIDRLSITFQRKVHGVLNSTDGVIFDLIQCLIQRNFAYATSDVRESYVQIKNALYDKKISKVVFILHSQGGIEGGLIIDWLLAEVPQEHLSRLEVYTFGNAANHFNNPCRTNSILARESGATRNSSTHASTAISHIEHYANNGDFVANIGVLNFSLDPRMNNRFMGKLFRSPYSGHLLNEHYLHQMFTLDKSNLKCLDSNPFMDMSINLLDSDDLGMRCEIDQSVQCNHSDTDDDDDDKEMRPQFTEVAVIGDVNAQTGDIELEGAAVAIGSKANGSSRQRKHKVKHLSRLWQYRNGGIPQDDMMKPAATF